MLAPAGTVALVDARRLAVVLLAVLLAAAPAPVDRGPHRTHEHGAGGFRYAALTNLGPVRWKACAEVRLLLNPAGAPTGAAAELRRAAQVIGRASDIRIRVIGQTTASPSAAWGTAKTAGGDWPPVLVAFVRPRAGLLQDPGSSAETTAVHVAHRPGAPERYVSGEVLLNAAQNDWYDSGDDHRASRVRLFEHELGHLLGLGHVRDPGSLMYPVILDREGLSAGDRRGLRATGRRPGGAAPCPQAR